jgi:predicted lipoprotein with Yx(FWY)xxD motif
MLAQSRTARARRRRWTLILAAVVAGFATAALAGFAVAKTFTLNVGKNAKVTNFNTRAVKSENVATNSKGFVIYTLSGDSKQHPKCRQNNGCLGFWPPVTASSAKKLSKASALKGRLGIWKRNGFNQVTLNGHPLYTFSMDSKRNAAGGEGIATFKGVWHVVKSSRQSSGSGTSPSSPPPMQPPPPTYPGY